MIAPTIFGGDTGLTYEQMLRKRALADTLQSSIGRPQNVGEGLGAVMKGIGAGMAGQRADRAATEGREKASSVFADLMRQRSGGGGYTPPSFSPAEMDRARVDGLGAIVEPAIDRAEGKPAAPGDLRGGIIETAQALGVDPVDLATVISYETAGTFDPTKAGPTTQWGQHRGLIQFGEPQAREHGVDWNDPIGSQLGADGAVARYMRASGLKPGMGLLDMYSTVNAGAPGLYDRSDANNGGAPGTVADKVRDQMGGHRQKAMALIGGDYAPPVGGGMGGGSGMGAMEPALIEAMSNPYMSEGQRSALGMLFQQRMQANQPMSEADALDLEIQRERLAQMRAPQAPERATQYVDGVGLIDTQSGEVIEQYGEGEPEFRQATPDEAAQYGAQAGQFGPDGRFYPLNPPSGMSLETNPDGSVSLRQGPGVQAGARPPTERQSTLRLFGGLMDETMPEIDRIESDPSFNPAGAGAALARGGAAGNMLASGVAQQYEALKRQWAEGVLRIQTGAAATTDEVNRVMETYFPRIGDDPATIAQKRQQREAFARSLGPASGGEMEAPGGADTRPGIGQPAAPPPAPSAAAPATGNYTQSEETFVNDPGVIAAAEAAGVTPAEMWRILRAGS